MTSTRSQAETGATEAGTEAAAQARLARLLDASPAVIYSFEAKGDFSPTYVSDQAREARGFAQGGVIPARYWRLSRLWVIWGTIATLLPLANLYFMVMKPA